MDLKTVQRPLQPGGSVLGSKEPRPKVAGMSFQEQLRRLAELRAMDMKVAVNAALAQKRRLYDELERRKLLKLA